MHLDLPPLAQGHGAGSEDFGGHKVVVFALRRGGVGLCVAVVVVVVVQLIDETAIVAIEVVEVVEVVQVVEVVDVEFAHGEA